METIRDSRLRELEYLQDELGRWTLDESEEFYYKEVERDGYIDTDEMSLSEYEKKYCEYEKLYDECFGKVK